MIFGSRNVRILNGSGSITTAVRELARFKLELVGVQEVTVGQRRNCKSRGYTLFYEKGNENHQLRTEFFVHQKRTR
jgi:hypothetical protein